MEEAKTKKVEVEVVEVENIKKRKSDEESVESTKKQKSEEGNQETHVIVGCKFIDYCEVSLDTVHIWVCKGKAWFSLYKHTHQDDIANESEWWLNEFPMDYHGTDGNFSVSFDPAKDSREDYVVGVEEAIRRVQRLVDLGASVHFETTEFYINISDDNPSFNGAKFTPYIHDAWEKTIGAVQRGVKLEKEKQVLLQIKN